MASLSIIKTTSTHKINQYRYRTEQNEQKKGVLGIGKDPYPEGEKLAAAASLLVAEG
jgi:hypothetical protein